MATKTFVVEITVTARCSESTFGTSIVKGLQDGDVHHLSFLHSIVEDINVRPYEEPAQEWEVTFDAGSGLGSQEGYRGTYASVLLMAKERHPDWPIVGARVKE